ncbi:hypothetical protein RN96_10680 [Fusobacterium polymorphum]|uniref:Uncharacterized protein n=1 Tax=Fusobacterium nucleatum subsp. polymorphum TaxID=76857 RepID=A0A2B7YHZ3_FUSNP|nr:hypothetical protein [Fusobacterium polymorphum]PGH20631.1 hypothetical protein RN96_10680 [Fusobacterium polymorphum]
MQSYINNHLYIAKIVNLSKNKDITDYIDDCNITLPKTSEISSMEASFVIEEKLIDTGNEVKIEVLDEKKKVLYSLQGKATLERRNKSYTGKETFTYSIKDSYDKLFDKVVPETMVFFDLFFCNISDKYNSLLHIVANKLGFTDEQIDFVNIAFEDGSLMRVPFVLFEQDERWVDILQRFIKATDSILYIKNRKLFSRPRNFMLNQVLKFDRTNIITEVEEVFKSTLYNGIRVNYDRFIKLENQVVFNLSQKIIVNPYTRMGASEVQSMKITYTTSSVSNPTITKATGYYFTREDDIKSKVDINLIKDYHYKIEEWKETQAIVKFFNPHQYKLYIENFEIKGLPLVKYQDNEAVIKRYDVIEKRQENFISIQKNREVQTEKLAKYIALSEYKSQILNNRTFNFNTYFLKDIELGEVYKLELEDINTVVRVTNIQISLKPAQFEMRIETECIENNGQFTYSNVLSGKSNNNFIDLKPLQEKIDENSKNLRVLDRDVRSKLFRQKTEPNISDVKENDIWLNPDTNIWKKYYNNTWNPISEEEILPAMKMYNSIEGNVIKLQGTADKVGAYLLNSGEKFGSLNGELAHITFDKMGQFEAENPNNRVALNIKDPANPSRITSQILLGVTDITDRKWKDTIFAIGDEASSNRIEFKNNQVYQTVNGVEIGTKIRNVETAIGGVNKTAAEAKNSANTAQTTANGAKTAATNAQTTANNATTSANNAMNKANSAYNLANTSQSKANSAYSYANTIEGALKQGDFIITGKTVFDGSARFVSRGTNEVITIANGAIDFYRNGIRLTRIKNIRYGIIATDSKGKGVVNFDGFQQPMILLTAVKSANFGKNMASIFCYAEHINGTQYRFYVGGTNEDYREANPIKVVGTRWGMNNVVISTLLGITGFTDSIYFKGELNKISGLNIKATDISNFSLNEKSRHRRKYINIVRSPIVNVKVRRNGEIIFDKNFGIGFNYNFLGITLVEYAINSLNISSQLNILKNFYQRTNVGYSLEITVLESRLEVQGELYYTRSVGGDKNGKYEEMHYAFNGVIFNLTTSHFKGLSITASAETSTLSNTTGSGEVQYIAMEVD